MSDKELILKAVRRMCKDREEAAHWAMIDGKAMPERQELLAEAKELADLAVKIDEYMEDDIPV